MNLKNIQQQYLEIPIHARASRLKYDFTCFTAHLSHGLIYLHVYPELLLFRVPGYPELHIYIISVLGL